MRQVWIGTFLATLAGLGLGDAIAAPVGPQSIEAQLKACAKSCSGGSLKADDQATCKLECRYQFEAQPPAPPVPSRTAPPPRPAPAPGPAAAAPKTWTAADLTRCEGVCATEPLSTDRATCKLQCRSKAAELSAPRAAPSPRPAPRPNSSWRAAPTPPATTQYTPSGRLSANGPMVYSPGIPTMAQPAPDRAALQAEVNQCRAQCNRGSYTNSTDRETCRLNCNTILDSAPQGTVYHNAGSSAADARRAVIESSGGVAGHARPSYPASQYRAPTSTHTSPPAPPSKIHGTIAAAPKPATPPAPTCAAVTSCNQGCSGAQSSCIASCEQSNARATDRATCKLSCKNNLGVCSEGCAEKASTCNVKTAAK